MTMQMPFEPKGVIPACLLPFKSDMEIDEKAFRSHFVTSLRWKGLALLPSMLIQWKSTRYQLKSKLKH